MVGTFHDLLLVYDGLATLFLTLDMSFAQQRLLPSPQLVYPWLVLPCAVDSLLNGGIQSAPK